MENIDNKDYGVVYVMYNVDFNIVKIGKSRFVESRSKSVSCASGCEIILMYSSKPVSDYGKIERLAHEHFKDKRRQYGEWFNMTDAEAYLFISKLIKEENIHPIAKMYEDKVSIADIALKYNVSRAYITKLLKDWNVYVKISHKNVPDKIRYKVQHSVKENVLNNVPAKYTRNSKYIRLSENLYKHGLDEVYKVVKYSKGIFKDNYFNSKEEAELFLSGK
jgi:predicted DNA-binding protein YlxM (UPF0122 family)